MKDFRKVSLLAARAASDKKAEDIALYHIKPISGLADYLLLATVDSPPQLEAVEDGVDKALRDEGLRPIRREGSRSDSWRVLDYGGLLVHLMLRDPREFYALDKLFIEARRVAWEEKAAVPVRRRKPAVRRRRA